MYNTSAAKGLGSGSAQPAKDSSSRLSPEKCYFPRDGLRKAHTGGGGKTPFTIEDPSPMTTLGQMPKPAIHQNSLVTTCQNNMVMYVDSAFYALMQIQRREQQVLYEQRASEATRGLRPRRSSVKPSSVIS